MYVSGYQFYVLNNAFTNHLGFQTLKTRPVWRAQQSSVNSRKFHNFALELIAKYGRDPYGMAERLKKMNLKNAQVNYGSNEKKQDRGRR